jgi:hypothetical protein
MGQHSRYLSKAIIGEISNGVSNPFWLGENIHTKIVSCDI